MAKDLTVSAVDRQNILNNPFAVAEIQKSIGIKGIDFNGKVVLLKEQVAVFLKLPFVPLKIIWQATRMSFTRTVTRFCEVNH
jgi:hypothetical protein